MTVRRGMALVVLAGCGRIGFDPASDFDAAPGNLDASSDAGADAAPLGPWTDRGILDIAAAGTILDDPSLSQDRLTLLVNQGDMVGMSTRSMVTEPWGPLVFDAQLSTNAETEPELAPDGMTVHLGSARGTSAGFDIWRLQRVSRTTWGSATTVSPLDSPSDDTGGSITSDGLQLVIARGAFPDRNLLWSERENATAPWPPPVPIPNVNSASDEAGGFITPDGLHLYFMSARLGGEDLFVASRPSRAVDFGSPEPIAELNTPDDDADPWVSSDGRYMVWATDRGSGYELHEATR